MKARDVAKIKPTLTGRPGNRKIDVGKLEPWGRRSVMAKYVQLRGEKLKRSEDG